MCKGIWSCYSRPLLPFCFVSPHFSIPCLNSSRVRGQYSLFSAVMLHRYRLQQPAHIKYFINSSRIVHWTVKDQEPLLTTATFRIKVAHGTQEQHLTSASGNSPQHTCRIVMCFPCLRSAAPSSATSLAQLRRWRFLLKGSTIPKIGLLHDTQWHVVPTMNKDTTMQW